MLEQINHILFWVGIAWIIIYTQILIFNRGIPNIETAPAIRKQIIEWLQEDFKTRHLDHSTIVDLGSGNGLFTREIAKAIPEAKVIGIEISPHLVAESNLRKQKEKLANLEYRQMDFMSYHFAEADAVVMYLVAYTAAQVGKKLNREARPGTFIASNKFRLGEGWEPIQSMTIKTPYFHQGNLYLYRKAAT